MQSVKMFWFIALYSATINLFKRLSHDIADNNKFSYPYNLEKSVYEWIDQRKGPI